MQINSKLYQCFSDIDIKTFHTNKTYYYHDDSSDGEEVNNSIANYRIVDNANINTMLYAAGINLLYSKEVNKIYYQLKSEQLKDNIISVADIKNYINIVVKNTIKISLAKVEAFIDNENQFVENIYKQVIDKLNFNEICSNLNPKQLVEDISNKLKNNLENCLNNIDIVAILDEINTKDYIIKQLPINQNDPKDTYSFTISFNGKEQFDRLYEFDKYAQEIAIQTLINIGFLDGQRKTRAKDEIKKFPQKLISDCHTPKLAGYASEYLKSFRKSYSAENKLKIDVKRQAAFNLLIDSINLDNKNELNYDDWHTVFTKHKDFILYFKLNYNNIAKFIKNDILNTMSSGIEKNLLNIKRNILAEDYTLNSNSSIEFLANLRLSNRSEKRRIKNIKHEPMYSDLKIGKSECVTKQQKWKLEQNYFINETQNIYLANNNSRSDYVDNAGSYAAIKTKIDNIKASCNLTDCQIADLIRLIIINKAQENKVWQKLNKVIQQFLLNISYLLFGCEVKRNPVSLILHIVMLDLILNNKNLKMNESKVTFSEALDLMPMAEKDAVPTSRRIISQIRQIHHLPYPYTYEGSEDKTSDNKLYTMKDKEKVLFDKWMLIKKHNCTNLSNSQILTMVQNYCKKWLDI